MRNFKNRFTKTLCIAFCALLTSVSAWAQNVTVSGVVVDESGEAIVGATISVKGTTTATMSDFDGNFKLTVPTGSTLQVTYIGFTTEEISQYEPNTPLRVTLVDELKELSEVIVVGYGQQKKASIVGAITQTTGEVLERAAGITDVSAALTGNLPGVITVQGNGQPGEEEAKITIRGASSWNNSDPLVLVDGIERPMNAVDIASIASMSVLKDASATAVYGVKGANGVILITTKRGQEGKAHIEVNLGATMKQPSKLPGKYDSYDALMARNVAIEHELSAMPESWNYIRPQAFIEKYRNQTTLEQRERYANVDWQDALFNKHAMSYNANLNIMGGTAFVRYFASFDYAKEGDLYKLYDNGRNYETGYGYDRINVRSNLDFTITKYTIFKVNISGSTGFRMAPAANAGDQWQESQRWAGAYNIAPDVFLPQYSDLAWGNYPDVSNVTNSAQNLTTGGRQTNTASRINTDFTLEQDLSFLTEGLNLRATISWDNNFKENGRGISDMYNDFQAKNINPITGIVTYDQVMNANNKFDFKETVAWTANGGQADNWGLSRNLYYQVQANWARQFGRHNVTLMGLFSRQENATGNMIPSVREDWAFRTTYNFADRYFFEYNGAYNGSEKFSAENRFAFFSSGAVGWMVSEEAFFQPLKKVVDMLKIRYSLGEIGNDNVGGKRWLYMTQWSYGGQSVMDNTGGNSTYQYYRQSGLGNPDAKWETVRKQNLGIDYSFLGGMFAGSVELFRDDRRDILIDGKDRAVPAYFGAEAPVSNDGKAQTRGYEVELRFNKQFGDVRVWANTNMNHAESKIIFKDDKELTPNYQKQEGYAIGQYREYIDAGYIQSYDQLIGAPAHDANNNHRLPGDYYIIDFNADGVVDSKDKVPVGFAGTPQKTYNATVGVDYKGFGAFVQFYGASNVTRDVPLKDFWSQLNTVYEKGDWWTKETGTGDVTPSRFASTPYDAAQGTQYLYDGSYLRLKNAEISYTFGKDSWINRIGMKSLRVFLGGNNLWLWTKMPDDRESNLGFGGGSGAYPTVRRYNFGLKFSF